MHYEGLAGYEPDRLIVPSCKRSHRHAVALLETVGWPIGEGEFRSHGRVLEVSGRPFDTGAGPSTLEISCEMGSVLEQGAQIRLFWGIELESVYYRGVYERSKSIL